jgi:hypothetical protein
MPIGIGKAWVTLAKQGVGHMAIDVLVAQVFEKSSKQRRRLMGLAHHKSFARSRTARSSCSSKMT